MEKHPFPTRFSVKGLSVDSEKKVQPVLTVNKGLFIRFLKADLWLSIFPDRFLPDRMWNTELFNGSNLLTLWRVCVYRCTIKNIPGIALKDPGLST